MFATMLLVVGTIRLSPENLERARPAMRRLVEATRQEDGCLAYNYSEDLLDPGLVHIDEIWTEQARLDSHLKAPHVFEWRAVSPDFAISDRNLRIYEVSDSRPL